MSNEYATGFRTNGCVEPINCDEMPFSIPNTARPVGIIWVYVWAVLVNVPYRDVTVSTWIVNLYKPYANEFDWMTKLDDWNDGLADKSIIIPESRFCNVHVYMFVYDELQAKYIEVLKLKRTDR